jgi:hypothetical protein
MSRRTKVDPGLDRRDGLHSRKEGWLVQLLRLGEVVDGGLGVAVGVGEEAHGHEPPVAPLVLRRSVADSGGDLEVPSGAL